MTEHEQQSGRGPAEETEPQVSEREGPVVRDKRRIDPDTGAVREAGATSPAPGPDAPEAETASPVEAAADERARELEGQLRERTADLQRLQAEYVNYRRRVERDREAVRELALVNVLTSLLPVLDDIGRAREHGELEGGFKSVAESFESTVEKLGLQRFGEPGDAFDPMVHEALMHTYSADVSDTTCVAVIDPGYRLGERIIRPARVAVADPEPAETEPAESQPAAGDTAPDAQPPADGRQESDT